MDIYKIYEKWAKQLGKYATTLDQGAQDRNTKHVLWISLFLTVFVVFFSALGEMAREELAKRGDAK